VIYALEDNRLTGDIRGSAALVHPGKIESFLVGPTYFVGDLPLLTSARLLLANHPILLAIMAVLALLILTFALSRALKLLADRRRGRKLTQHFVPNIFTRTVFVFALGIFAAADAIEDKCGYGLE
jgi:hypothetical protein